MLVRLLTVVSKVGRSPHGERGLKFVCFRAPNTVGSRSPHGERGLKSWRSPAGRSGEYVALLTESVD